MSYTTKTAVLVVPFSRADCYERTLRAIREARPPRLYLAMDAPRPHVAGEAERVAATRAVTARVVDWPCEVRTLVAEKNLGPNPRVASAVDWIFSHEERAIIFDDDCVAHPTFFQFCDELLEKYADDERVGMISGNQFVPGGWPGADGASYAFARLGQIWGWATWRRAWRNYDYDMQAWPAARRSDFLSRIFPRRRDQVYWRKNFDDIRDPGCWDYRWCFARWLHRQVAVVPAVNLSQNIGFRPDATHTTQLDHPAANVPLVALEFPLRHPARVALDEALDAETTRLIFSTGTIAHRLGCHWRRNLGRARKFLGLP